MEKLKKGVNSDITTVYSIDCPHCGETTYSDIHHEDWGGLEWGDGHPHGEMKCNDCEEWFEVEIEG